MSDAVQFLLSRPAVFEHGAYLPASLDPDAAKREYLRAARSDGSIDWGDVLDLAEDPSSALHDAIEWDDAMAASKQRRGTIVAIAWALRDKATGERLFESLHYRTRNPEDVGRIRINVRVLPPSSAPEPQRYVVHTQPIEPAASPAAQTPLLVDMSQEVVDRTPDEDRSLDVFRRWVDAHKHEPAVLRAALRLLYDVL